MVDVQVRRRLLVKYTCSIPTNFFGDLPCFPAYLLTIQKYESSGATGEGGFGRILSTGSRKPYGAMAITKRRKSPLTAFSDMMQLEPWLMENFNSDPQRSEDRRGRQPAGIRLDAIGCHRTAAQTLQGACPGTMNGAGTRFKNADGQFTELIGGVLLIFTLQICCFGEAANQECRQGWRSAHGRQGQRSGGASPCGFGKRTPIPHRWHGALGELLFKERDYEACIPELNVAVGTDPDSRKYTICWPRLSLAHNASGLRWIF